MSAFQSPPTPLIGAAPRPPPRPPRPPPPGKPAWTAPRPPVPRPAAGVFIAAEPAAPAAPTTPTTVWPKGEPGRRVKAKGVPSCEHEGDASRTTPGNGE